MASWDRTEEEQGRFTMNPAERRLEREVEIGRKQLNEIPKREPPPPIGELRTPNSKFDPTGGRTPGDVATFSKGGRVKHGSDTRVVCKDKFHG